MPDKPANLAHVRTVVKSLREAADRHRSGTATALGPTGPDRSKTLDYVRSQAKLRRKGAPTEEQLDFGFDRTFAVKRLGVLVKGEFQDRDFFRQTYGLSDDSLSALEVNISAWGNRMARAFVNGAKLSRWTFERFLSEFRLFPPRQASARISVSLESIPHLIEFARKKLGVPDTDIGVEGVAIKTSFLDGLPRFFRSLAYTTFGDHDGYCRALHGELRREGVSIEAVTDPTPRALGEDGDDMTYQVDVITLKPMGIRDAVWVDFSKPLDLGPDHVSLLTLAHLEHALKPYVASYALPDAAMLDIARAVTGND
jgi:hypothetical protein